MKPEREIVFRIVLDSVLTVFRLTPMMQAESWTGVGEMLVGDYDVIAGRNRIIGFFRLGGVSWSG